MPFLYVIMMNAASYIFIILELCTLIHSLCFNVLTLFYSSFCVLFCYLFSFGLVKLWLKKINLLLLTNYYYFFISIKLSQGNYYQVFIECHTHIPLLTETVYWKGIHFSPLEPLKRQGNSSLEYVDVTNAAVGIKALDKVPSLVNVTIRDGFTGLLANNLQTSLEIVDSAFFRNHYVGINVTSSGGPVMIQNVTVCDSSFGDGFVYKQVLQSYLDFCSILPREVSFPLILNATGKPFSVNCSKVGINIYCFSVCIRAVSRNSSIWLVLGAGRMFIFLNQHHCTQER